MSGATELLTLLAAGVLGMQAGALLAEGAVLVPFWRTLAPEAFLTWYREHAGLLLRFFGPLEIAAALLAIGATGSAYATGAGGRHWLAASAGLALAVLAAFPLYFRRANASFAEASIAPERVSDELRRWSAWHGLRVLLAVGAFASALVARAT